MGWVPYFSGHKKADEKQKDETRRVSSKKAVMGNKKELSKGVAGLGFHKSTEGPVDQKRVTALVDKPER